MFFDLEDFEGKTVPKSELNFWWLSICLMSTWRNSDDSVLLGMQAETQRGTGILLLNLKLPKATEKATDNKIDSTGTWASQAS